VRARLGEIFLPFCEIPHKNAVIGQRRPFFLGRYRDKFVDFFLRRIPM